MDDFRILCRDWQDPDGHQIVKYVFKSELDPFENSLNDFFPSTVVILGHGSWRQEGGKNRSSRGGGT